MNKLLVTGLALGKEIGLCDVCNFDFEWIVRYPSTFIWADKILVSQFIWDTAMRADWPSERPELAKSIKLIFTILKDTDIIDIVNPLEVINTDLKNNIEKEVEKDRILLADIFPEDIELGDEDKVPGQIFINGIEYCNPYLSTVYASLLLSRVWKAHSLFNESVFNFCKYKFGLSSYPKEAYPSINESFKTIFNAYIPNTPIFPEYVLVSKKLCGDCVKERGCKNSYLSEIEKNLKYILKWRDYDEVHYIKEIINDILIKREEGSGIITQKEILNEFQNRESIIRKKIKSIFPKVKRWANITMIISIPIAVTGVATGSNLITIAGSGLIGLSKLSKEIVDYLTNKYNWVGFLNKEVELYHD